MALIESLLLIQAAAAVAPPEKPVLDRYYQCLADQALRLEGSGEPANFVATATVHKCRHLFVDAATALRTDKADDARKVGLDMSNQSNFERDFRDYSHDYALTRVVEARLWKND